MDAIARDRLIAEAKSAYGSASAERVGDLLFRLVAALETLQALSQAEHTELLAVREELRRRESEVSLLRAKVFGATSEKDSAGAEYVSAAQTPLADAEPASGESAEIHPAAAENADELGQQRAQAKALRREARRLMREIRPSSKKTVLGPEIQREIVRRPLPEDFQLTCPLCGEEVEGRGVSERAEEIDTCASVVTHRVYELEQGSCLCGALRFTMPRPVRGVAQTNFSPRFVADLAYKKFMQHLPCYRQAQALAGQGLKIHRDRLIRLLAGAWLGLEPLVKRICELNRAETYQSCDESPIRTVIKGAKQIRFLWCLVTNLAVCYKVTAGRSRQDAREVTGTGRGVLTTDRLGIYHGLCEGKEESGCMAHGRRRFWYSLPSAPLESLRIIALMRELYAVEREAKISAFAAGQRFQLRQSKSLPILERLQLALHAIDPPPRSRLGEAKAYMLAHWDVLIYFTKDGQVEIDNNHTEAQLRGPKLGWKNFLFTQSEVGCEVAAGFYTIFATCVLHGKNPQRYLADVLTKLGDDWPRDRLDELLPWNWQDAEATPESSPQRKVEKIPAAKVLSLSRIKRRIAQAQQLARG